MPKVPVYQEGQVQTAQLPNLGNTPKPLAETFGGGSASIAKNIEEVVPVATRIYLEEKKKADEIALSEAQAKLTKIETDLLYDPKIGALNKKGKDSFDVAYTTNMQFEKETGNIEAALSNDDQKAAFQKIRQDRALNIDRSLQKHVSTESIRYDQNVTTSLIKAEQDAAIQNYTNPARVQEALNKQQEALTQFAARNGISDEELKTQLLKVKSETHENVIQRLLSNDQDFGAQSYFKKYKGEIEGDKLARIEGALDIGINRATAQRKVDTWIDKGLSIGEAYEEASSIGDSKLREQIETRIARQYAIKENAERDRIEKVHISALNIIDQTKDINEVIKGMPNEWQAMDVSKRNSLINYAQQKAEGRTKQASDPEVFYELKLLASAKDTRDDFITMDLTKYRNNLSDADWKDLVSDQTALRNKDGSVDTKLDGFQSKQQVISEGFQQAGFDKKDKKELFRYNAIIDKEIAVQQDTLKRKLTNDEVRNIVKDYTYEVVTKENKFWFDEKKKLFELNADEIKTIKYKDIPASDKLKAENALKKLGQPVTEDRVRKLFINKFLSRQGG